MVRFAAAMLCKKLSKIRSIAPQSRIGELTSQTNFGGGCSLDHDITRHPPGGGFRPGAGDHHDHRQHLCHLTEEQFFSRARQQKRVMERRQARERARLEKLARKTDLPVTFDNQTITAFGGFGMLEAFKQVIGFTQLVQRHLQVHRHHNCQYTATQLIDIVTDAMVFGLSRLDHWTILMLSKRTRDTSFSRSWTGHRMSGPCAICWASSVPTRLMPYAG